MIIPPAASVDHPMGDSRFMDLPMPINDINRLIYIQIPKNASCWTKHHFMPADAYNYYTDGLDNKHHLALVILRDPVERWISGMGQFLAGNSPGSKMYIDTIDWEQVTNKVMFDDHTQPQVDFIANVPWESVVWFKCNNHLPHNFIDFMKNYNIDVNLLDEKDDVTNIFNVTKKVQSRIIKKNNYLAPAQQTIVDKIINKLNENPKYVDRIKEFYQNDYKLYNTVPYYVAR